MKTSAYTENQIALALLQTEGGTPVADLTLDKHVLGEIIVRKL